MNEKLIKNKIILNLFTFFICFIISYTLFSFWMEINGIWSNIFMSFFTSLVVTIALHFGLKKTLRRINPNLDIIKNGK